MAAVQIRGMTAFSFTTTRPPSAVLAEVESIVAQFAAQTPCVLDTKVDMDSDHSIWVEVGIAATLLADADQAMDTLCAKITSQFSNEVQERATELVPA